MKTIQLTFLSIALCLSPTFTYAIEANEKIKVTPVLKTQNTWINQAINYPTGKAEITGQVVEIAPGAETGWHSHPVPSFGYIIEGELEVHFKSGEIKHLKAGESAAEAVNLLHNGKNTGKSPVKLIVFYAGTAENKTTIKE